MPKPDGNSGLYVILCSEFKFKLIKENLRKKVPEQTRKTQMQSIQDIADQIYSDQTKSPQDMVNGYERFQDIIENAAPFATGEIHTLCARLTSDYGIALTWVGFYRKAVEYLDKGLSLLLSDPAVDKTDLKNHKFYEALLSNGGVCNYHLKAYQKSMADFRQLKRLFPENHTYDDWIKGIKSIRLKYASKVFLWLTAVLILMNVIVKRMEFPHKLFFWGFILALLVIVFSIFCVLEATLFLERNRSVNSKNKSA